MEVKVYYLTEGGGCKRYADAAADFFDTKALKLPTNLVQLKSCVVVFLLPVYAQDIAAFILKRLSNIRADECTAVPVAVYGGINAGRALKTMSNQLVKCGFSIIGGGEFIAEHNYSVCLQKIANLRPNSNDIAEFTEFLKSVMLAKSFNTALFPAAKNIFSFLPQKFLAAMSVRLPKISAPEKCSKCKKCVEICPVLAISPDLKIDKNVCVRCLKCAKYCEKSARRIKLSQPFIRLYLSKSRKKRNITYLL